MCIQFRVHILVHVFVRCTVIFLVLCSQEPVGEGTVKAHPRFNAEADAKALRDAMKGFGELIFID